MRQALPWETLTPEQMLTRVVDVDLRAVLTIGVPQLSADRSMLTSIGSVTSIGSYGGQVLERLRDDQTAV
jgi:hypothetical protein